METLSIGGLLEATYTYDTRGLQVKRQLGNGQIFHMIHDHMGRRLADYEVTSGSPVLLQEYIWLEDRVVAAVVSNGTTAGRYIRIHTDHMNRPVAGFLDGADGALAYGVTYTPFGETHAVTGANLPELGFPGQWFREESGLFQNWMRDYDPSLGAYIQPDPLGLVDGSAVYRYASGNPMRYSDPTGLCPWCYAAAGAAVGGGANLGYQLYKYDGNFSCVDWSEVGAWAAAGSFGGGFVGHYVKGMPVFRFVADSAARKKFRKAYGLKGRDVEVSHGIVPARNWSGARVKGASWRHHPMNFRATPTSVNRRFQGAWKGQKKFTPIQQVGYSVAYAPEWSIVSGGSLAAGGLYEFFD